MAVHARPVVLEQRLRHERHRQVVGPCHRLGDVLVEHQLVGHGQQRVEPHVDLRLAGGADLVVLDLGLDPDLLQRQDHLGPEVLEMVHGRDREIPLLVPGLEPEVRPLVGVGVPDALDGVDRVRRRVLVLVEADIVEDVELRLRPEVGGVGQAGRHEVLLRLLGHEPGVAGVGVAGHRVAHEAVEVEGLELAERVDDRGVGVGHEDHVRLLDLLEATDRRPVEPVALLEPLLGQGVGGGREVLHEPREVAEAEVDDLHALLLHEPHHVSRAAFLHGVLLVDRPGARNRRPP